MVVVVVVVDDSGDGDDDGNDFVKLVLLWLRARDNSRPPVLRISRSEPLKEIPRSTVGPVVAV